MKIIKKILFIFFSPFALRLSPFIFSFIIWVSGVYAGEVLSQAKLFFLQEKYVQTIDECARAIQEHPDSYDILSEANYFTGASYVNLFDFLTAKKNFKAVVDKYKGTAYYEDAYMGLGDVEFLQENYEQALKVYLDFLATQPSKKRLATLYFRLSELYLKKGDKSEYKNYLDRLEREFPLSFEARDARRLSFQEQYFTVQVGAFSNYENAEKFIQVLKDKGYDVYSGVCMLSGKKLCRIRVGRCSTLKEAELLKERLEIEGYPAKVFPLER